MDKYKTLLSNTLIFAIGTFSSKVLVFLLMPLYTRVLDTAEYGTVDLIIQIGNLLLPLVSIGIINGVVRFGLDKNYRKNDVFSTGFFTILVGFAFLLMLEPFVSQIPYLAGNTLLIYVFVFFSSLRSLCSQFVRAKGYVRLYAVDGILSTATTILFNILYLLFLKLGVLGYMLAIISADFLSTIFLSVAAKLYLYIHFNRLRKSTVLGMLRYSIPLIPNTMLWWITNVSDRYLVTAILGPQANGLYAVSYKVPTMIVLVSSIFMDAWQMSAVGEANSAKREAFFSKVFLYFQALVFTAASGLILCAKLISKILVSEAFYLSWEYIPFLVMATSFSCMVSFLGSIYMVEKKSVLSLLTTASGAVINIGLNYLLIPIPAFGVNGAAFATFVSYFVVFLLRAADTRRFLKMHWNAKRMAVSTIVLFLQSIIMITEVPGWLAYELLFTSLMVFFNIGALLPTLRRWLRRVA